MGIPDQISSSLPKDLFLWSRRLQQILCLIALLGLIIYEALPAGRLQTHNAPSLNSVIRGLHKVLIGAGFVSLLKVQQQ